MNAASMSDYQLADWLDSTGFPQAAEAGARLRDYRNATPDAPPETPVSEQLADITPASRTEPEVSDLSAVSPKRTKTS